LKNNNSEESQEVQAMSAPVYKKIIVQYQDDNGDAVSVDSENPLPVSANLTLSAGDYTVAGSVLAIPTGTYTVAGSFTATPVGTQPVSGTITATPTGTYTVAGSVTSIPSGIHTIVPTGTFTVAASAQGQKNSNSSFPVVIASDQSNVGVSLNALNYPASTKNSTTTQLNAFATFTGVLETILNQQAAQISIFSDQPFSLYVDQFLDATTTYPVSTDVFSRNSLGSLGGYELNENVTLPGNYFRIRITNNGGSTTTSLNCSTTFGIMATGPRSITSLGNNKSAINEINGNSIDSNTGTATGGTIRVVIATNQPAITVAPTGTQSISGTVTATPTGTYTVAGTVTATPTGTYTVSGTVAANPTGVYTVTNNGTQTVAGNVTANPTGTYTVAGTTTATPTGVYTVTNSGTQAVSGTVTAAPTGTQAVSGTVTATPTGTYTVLGTVTANPTGAYTVAGTTTATPTGVYTVTNSGTQTVAVSGVVNQSFASSSTDAFGKLRVTEPTTLGDYHHVSGENPEMLTKTSGSGTGTVDFGTSSYILSVGTANGDYAIHQSRMYHHYLPGKSQLFLQSFCIGTARVNTAKRSGYFDDRNGIFFQQAGDGTLSFVFRTYVTGAAVDTVVTQANWNHDTCNASILGTGVLPNGSNAVNYGVAGSWTLDITKVQLIMLDFQWLGVGRLRVGFVHDGNWIIAHEFYHSNYISNVYWTQPSLPIRCEIRNTGTASGTATMKQICSTVMSEGGYLETGLVNSINSSLSGITITNGGDTIALVAIRLKNSLNGDLVRGIVRAKQASIIVTDGPVYAQLVRFDSHTTITGGSWVSSGSDSIVEYNVTATAYSGGTVVSSQFVEAAASKNTTGSGEIVNPVSNKRGFIAQNYDSSDSGAYALCATALGTANNVGIKAYGSLQWSETR